MCLLALTRVYQAIYWLGCLTCYVVLWALCGIWVFASVSYLAIKRCPFWELSLRSLFPLLRRSLLISQAPTWQLLPWFPEWLLSPSERLWTGRGEDSAGEGAGCWAWKPELDLLGSAGWKERTNSSRPVTGTHKHGVWLLLSCDIHTPVDSMCVACGSFNTKNKQNLKIRKSLPRLIPWSVISYFFSNASQDLDLTFGVDFHTGLRSKDLVLFSWCRYPVSTATFVEKPSFFSNI